MPYTENYLSIPKYHVLTEKDSKEWSDYVKKSVNYDVYHTLHYHILDNRGEPVLFVYEEGGTFVALPLLKRAIEGTDFFDFTSSYGYSGPISNKRMEALSDNLIENFKYSLINFMKSNKAVSVFSRLNPFINQRFLLDKIGGVRGNGKTICIDLTESIGEQRSKYHKRLNRQIRQLRKKNYTIKKGNTEEEIKQFTKMYNQNMLRVGAAQSYFFDENYFAALLANTDFNCELVLIYDDGKMICGATVMWLDGVIRNHLSATSESHVQFSPSKLLTDEISIIGREYGMKFFHLGGGVGGKEDTLFNFKSSFSNLFLDDNIWCFIADVDIYHQLVEQRQVKASEDYFPLYRNI